MAHFVIAQFYLYSTYKNKYSTSSFKSKSLDYHRTQIEMWTPTWNKYTTWTMLIGFWIWLVYPNPSTAEHFWETGKTRTSVVFLPAQLCCASNWLEVATRRTAVKGLIYKSKKLQFFWVCVWSPKAVVTRCMQHRNSKWARTTYNAMMNTFYNELWWRLVLDNQFNLYTPCIQSLLF